MIGLGFFWPDVDGVVDDDDDVCDAMGFDVCTGDDATAGIRFAV
jgi:hypothetical protein